VTVYVVRHADALGRSHWNGEDLARPLTEKGFAQARGLVDLLADARIDTIVSSPAVRCTQSVVPLAEDRGLEVVEDGALWEGGPVTAFRRLVDELDHAVFCSHGDLIPALIDQLIGEGLDAIGRDCKKGSTWVLEREGPAFARGTYLPPPKRDKADRD
jgi:broad specificity phosphatase PhoE